MTASSSTFHSPSQELAALLEQVHLIGEQVLALHAPSVDREARFPRESIDALKAAKLLSCYIPKEFGGMGLSVIEVARICEALGAYCGSTAMVFAMHQSQVGCVVHHALSTPFFKEYARQMVAEQILLASATTEMGIGGDVRSSICAPVIEGTRLTLQKQAPVISYAEHADAILVTSRRSADAQRGDQIQTLFRKGDFTLKALSGWDTLGFRGTCSLGFTFDGACDVQQILPAPYSEIHARTMHPLAHTVWSSLWLGLASDAVAKARSMVRAEARKTPGTLPPSALRLAEVDALLFTMRGGIYNAITEYEHLLTEGSPDAFSNFAFAARIANLKVTASTQVVDVVSRAMIITGIQGYRNDSKLSLGRHLRDAYGAALMVNNDRILNQSSTMQIMRRD